MKSYYEPIAHVVTPQEDGQMLKTILHREMNISRRLLSRLKMTEQGITVNGERRYVSTRVQAGDRIEVRMEQEVSDDILPQPLPIEIVYEDEHLLVVNKEAGMIVHPTNGHYVNTLANAVVYYWQQNNEICRFRPIHRLDQETTGLVAIAKNPYAHQFISEQMIAGTVEKEYVAIVYGTPPAKSGTVDAPIDRDSDNPHIRVVREDGYPSVTHYETIEQFAKGAFMKLRLETGRTHQIRVHMKHIGCPLIGDKMYMDERFAGEAGAMAALIDRHALHAHKLAFVHPATRQRLELTAGLPVDMKTLAAALRE